MTNHMSCSASAWPICCAMTTSGAARPHSLDFSRVLMNDDQSLFVVLDVGYASGAGFGGLRGWMNSHGIGRKSP